jgi:hypothetical protein
MKRLGPAIERIGADLSLLILDPVSAAYVGDSHKDAEVRASLQPITDLAEHFGFAVLGIAHFAKNSSGRLPVERVMGSAAVGNAPRLVMGVARPSDPHAPRLLARVKSNIGPDGGGFEFHLVQTLVRQNEHDDGVPAQLIDWGKFVEGSARDLFAVEEPTKENARAEAAEFLREMLSSGPVMMTEIKDAASGHGHAWRTVERAKKDLGIKAAKADFKDGWQWSLPSTPSPNGEDRHH